MPELTVAGKTIVLDEEDFLVNQDDWNHDVARAIARRLGIDELSTEQIEIIEFIRKYYRQYEAFPMLNYVCKHVDQPKQCMNNEFINPMKAWKIAGLPKLDGIHFVNVDGKHYQMETCC
ncbi:TusE/DsrC/DsvC family sulfur relay protein [Desulfogranum marinum]|uniref:TusE/DsrC/DsvC family sulfur relay protein n=1 Tax=Desulfogranum marinum TaxID=453220 RepID=UPI001963E105|nr:TusE/DsrC/DsvC family sulfur relay protein [Desulfogranum marinum]MBM9514038.1 TusE/DsrC/DsvC family sulfur relay protein [Desulfogranum marinum]